MRDKLHDVSRDVAGGLETISESVKNHPLTAKTTEKSKLGELMDRQSSSENGHHRPRKRRRTRVSKACDECRVRKIRCDGGQPCEPCEAFERTCLYRTSRFHKLGSSHHMRALEESMTRARNYIEELHSSHVPHEKQKDIESLFASANAFKSPDYDSLTPERGNDSVPLENMMEDEEQLSTIDRKTASFYGDSSGFAFLQKTGQLVDEKTQNEHKDSESSQATQTAITKLFDSPLPDKQALDADVPVSRLLPSRESSSDLLKVVFSQVYPLLQFLHEPSFQSRTDRIYNVDPMDYDDSDHDFLPLLFSVIGLGFLFSKEKHNRYGCRRAVTEGMRHFIAARQMMDVTNCRDIESLQTLICFILFLMSTARLVTSHTYTGLALTSAIRLGLHSQGPVNDAFTEEEQGERRRVFETIVKMDIYTSSVLGLPSLTDLPKLESTLMRDVQLELESSQKDENTAVYESLAVAAGAKHLEVLLIIAKTINILYPDRKRPHHPERDGPTFVILTSEIVDLERAFKAWRESLPQSLQLDASAEAYESLSYELEMAHNFGHIVLYRPFLHYLAKSKAESHPDKRQLRCALACVKISKRTIQRSVELQKQGYLAPASWNSVYTIFLSIVTLVFFLACQGDAKEAAGIKQVAEAGTRILCSCECQDTGSRRCLDVLKVLIKRLSHIVPIDVDQIRKETPALCRSKEPVRSTDSSKTEKTERPASENAPNFLDWTGTDLSQSMTEFGQLHWQPSSTQPFMYATDAAYSVEHPLNYLHAEYPDPFRPGYHTSPSTSRASASDLGGGSSHHSTAGGAGGPPMSSIDGSATLQIPDRPELTHDSSNDTIEIPYAESFAWPFQTTSSVNQMVDGQGGDQGPPRSNPDYSSMQLSSEDIAAFMRINPASDPFQ